MKDVVGCLTELLRPVLFLVNATGSALPYHGGSLMMARTRMDDSATFLLAEDDAATMVAFRDILAGPGPPGSAPHQRRDS